MSRRLNSVHRVFLALLLLCAAPVEFAASSAQPLTPIETAQHIRISRSAEMLAYLQALAALDAQASIEVLGDSVQGRPLAAFVLRSPATPQPGRRLVVMMIGSLHGAAEAAGGEALLQLARDLVQGDLAPLRDDIDVVLIPDPNPDGRDLHRRSNANRVNLNTDFVAVTQPETVALKQAIIRFRPDIVLDAHEAAGYKRETLATQNYMTDFWAQFESANNPAVPAQAREFAYSVLLPDLIARTRDGGLSAQRYIAEITNIDKPITNGGFTLQNLRNTAALGGALSFLVETRLDARIDSFPTYRNIAQRIQRQAIVQRAFLHSVQANRAAIAVQVDQMRAALATEPAMLKVRYALDEAHPRVVLPMTHLDSRASEQRSFSDHRKLLASDLASMPPQLLVTAHVDEMAIWLARQGIAFERVAGGSFQVETHRYRWRADPLQGADLAASAVTALTLDSPALLIDLRQPQGRSAWLLLEPRSVSSVFQLEPYKSWLQPEQDFWIHPVLPAGAQR